MGFGVFIHRSDSIYDDVPSRHYQFPKQYLSRVEACVGDWILYYEPVKAKATKGYFAVAKVGSVAPDPTAPGLYRASIEPGSYLDFGHPVPFRGPKGLAERGLLNEAGRLTGRSQAAVRPISEADFDRIVEQGLFRQTAILPRDSEPAAGFEEAQPLFQYEETARPRTERLASRALRDRNFRRVVLSAYDERCALTGLKLINGGGRAEVQAAHIRPVDKGGPDIVSNGIALSGTAHWMFDRGLVGLSDDLDILVSRQVNDPATVQAMMNQDGRLRCPDRQRDRPHPAFLAWHRENCFKQ
ncbi:MAG: HNH endonuclease [Rhodospirillales bacterium]